MPPRPCSSPGYQFCTVEYLISASSRATRSRWRSGRRRTVATMACGRRSRRRRPAGCPARAPAEPLGDAAAAGRRVGPADPRPQHRLGADLRDEVLPLLVEGGHVLAGGDEVGERHVARRKSGAAGEHHHVDQGVRQHAAQGAADGGHVVRHQVGAFHPVPARVGETGESPAADVVLGGPGVAHRDQAEAENPGRLLAMLVGAHASQGITGVSASGTSASQQRTGALGTASRRNTATRWLHVASPSPPAWHEPCYLVPPVRGDYGQAPHWTR